MQRSSSSTETNIPHTKAHQIARSFQRYESDDASSTSRSRASTIQEEKKNELPFPAATPITPEDKVHGAKEDLFESGNDDTSENIEDVEPDINEDDLTETFEELPANVRSLTEKFLESLSARVHPTPLAVDALSQLFQDFYEQAELKLSEHVARIASQSSREASPAPSVSSRSSANSKSRTKTGPAVRGGEVDNDGDEQQLLTASEIASKRKTRKLLEMKKIAYEEAVERLVCAKVYDRIWRHRSTDDQERDQKLQSRAAALSLIGIGLKELHSGTDEADQNARSVLVNKEADIREWLVQVADDLARMNEKHYPLGKLQHLITAHKSLVKILSRLFPSSSSADEILPMLIYALVNSSCDGLHVVSNVSFIQRFRASNKLDGEAAYCLVNLEAAISFLETVDLSSLRKEEALRQASQESATRSRLESQSSTTRPRHSSSSSLIIENASRGSHHKTLSVSSDDNRLSSSPASSTASNQGRLSTIIQTQTNRLEAVRGDIIGSADQAFDNISSTLDNSFNFLFGRLKEQSKKGNIDERGNILPKTLEDARKLVGTPPPMDEDTATVGAVTANREKSYFSENKLTGPGNDGRTDKRLVHDSEDEILKRGGITKRNTIPGGQGEFSSQGPTSAPSQASASSAAVDSMRNLGNTLNPLKALPNMNIMPRFGRGAMPATQPLRSPSERLRHDTDGVKETSASSTDARVAEELRRTAVPLRKFLEIKDVKELKIKDVEELLNDYRRLARGINKAIKS